MKTKEHADSHLIDVLHRTQHMYGYLPTEVMDEIAQAMQIPTAHIWGVATFYHYFKLTPPGKHEISVCLGTACYVKGATQILQAIKDELKIDFGEMTQDGLFSLGPARCLGACGLAPVVMIGDRIHGELTPKKIVPDPQRVQEAGRERGRSRCTRRRRTGDCGLRIADCGLEETRAANPQSEIRNPQFAAVLERIYAAEMPEPADIEAVLLATDPDELGLLFDFRRSRSGGNSSGTACCCGGSSSSPTSAATRAMYCGLNRGNHRLPRYRLTRERDPGGGREYPGRRHQNRCAPERRRR